MLADFNNIFIPGRGISLEDTVTLEEYEGTKNKTIEILRREVRCLKRSLQELTKEVGKCSRKRVRKNKQIIV